MSESKRSLGVVEIVAGIVITALSLWIASIQSTVSTVTSLEPQIERLKRDVEQNTKWTSDWETNGILPLDVEQNAKITHLEEKVKKIEDLDLEARLARMELLLSQIHNELVKK